MAKYDATPLLNLLLKEESRPNVLTREQFEPFEPLFKLRTVEKDSPEEADLVELGKMYRSLIDPFKPTCIIKSKEDRTIILTLPRIFTSVRELPHDQQSAILSATNAKIFGSGAPPRYQAIAFGQMADALLAAQRLKDNIPIIYKTRQETEMIIDKFLTQYGKEPLKGKPVAPKDGGFDWEFDE